MALKSTVFKASLQIADIDHGYYADHALTLARHPSETDERMMVRLCALALQAHTLNSVCNGDGTLAFGAGLRHCFCQFSWYDRALRASAKMEK